MNKLFLMTLVVLSVCYSNAQQQMGGNGRYSHVKFRGNGGNGQTVGNNRNEQAPNGVSGPIDVFNEYGPGSDYGYGDIDMMTYNNPNTYKSNNMMPPGRRNANLNQLIKPYSHRYKGFDSNNGPYVQRQASNMSPSNQRDDPNMTPSSQTQTQDMSPSNQRDDPNMTPSSQTQAQDMSRSSRRDDSMMNPFNSNNEISGDMPCTFRISCNSNRDDSNTMPSSEIDDSEAILSAEIVNSMMIPSNCFIDGSGNLQCTFRISGATKDLNLKNKKDKKQKKTKKSNKKRRKNRTKPLGFSFEDYGSFEYYYGFDD